MQKTYIADFLVHSDVKGRQVILVLDDQLRVALQQQTQAVNVTILTAEVAGRIPIDVLGIDIDLFLNEILNYVQVAANAGHMQGRPQILGAAVKIPAEFGKDLDQLNVAFVGCHVHRSPAVTVALVQERLCELAVLFAQQLNTRLIVALFGTDPDDAEQLPLLAPLGLLNLLLSHDGLLGFLRQGILHGSVYRRVLERKRCLP